MIAILTALALASAQATPAAPPAPVISPEAEALGIEVARNGFLATLLPLVTGKEVEEMIAAHPELSDADKATLRATGKAQMQTVMDRVTATMGRQYAATMSVADMKAVIAFVTSPSGKTWHAAEPGVMMATVKAIDGFDYKGAVVADFCKQTGKLCPDAADSKK